MANAPNRKREVATIAARYPQSFGPPDETIDTRRRLLIPIIVRELNKIDGGNWRVLNRMDRNDDDPKPGRLTSDVIVWAPTKEHFDVLSANGSMWGALGPITDPDWVLEPWSNWPTWDDQTPPAPDPPPDDPAPPSDDEDVRHLQTQIDALKATVDALTGRVTRHIQP